MGQSAFCIFFLFDFFLSSFKHNKRYHNIKEKAACCFSITDIFPSFTSKCKEYFNLLMFYAYGLCVAIHLLLAAPVNLQNHKDF